LKIIITGGSGIIGCKIVRDLIEKNHEVHYTYCTNELDVGIGHQLDIRRKDKTINLISEIKPDFIIHTAALTNVDLCETNKKLANLLNVIGTENVLEGCKKTESKIIYISTSFVFDGKKERYNEDDKPCPINNYGLTKLRGEELVKKSELSYLILRTDQPYCWKEKWQRNNSVLRVLDQLQHGNILNEVDDWFNVPTYVPDLVNVVDYMINHTLLGTYHVTGSNFINRYEWALKIAGIFKLDKKLINPIKSKSLNLPTKRVNVNLSNKKLFDDTGIKMRGIIDGLKDMQKTQPK
jgi:dTDP-4-dehydrorhamnose reductase